MNCMGTNYYAVDRRPGYGALHVGKRCADGAPGEMVFLWAMNPSELEGYRQFLSDGFAYRFGRRVMTEIITACHRQDFTFAGIEFS